MSEPVTIIIAGDPVGKGRARSVIRKSATRGAFVGNYTPEKTRKYESVLRGAAERVMRNREKFTGPVSVDIVARFAVPASWSKRERADALLGNKLPTVAPDADNLLKVLDALNDVVWHDDRQIIEATIRKTYGAEPGLVITVMAA